MSIFDMQICLKLCSECVTNIVRVCWSIDSAIAIHDGTNTDFCVKAVGCDVYCVLKVPVVTVQSGF